MTRPEPIHAEHCRCSRCNPPRPGETHSPALAAALQAISAALVVAAIAWASSELRDQLLTFQPF